MPVQTSRGPLVEVSPAGGYNAVIMKTQENELLQEILERLRSLDPPVKKIPVSAPDQAMTMVFLDLADVCYITTRTDSDRKELMFVTRDGERFYNNMSLKDVEEMLQEHPHFLRTSKFYLVNLARIRGFKYSNERDLWFDGIEEPVENAVSETYLPAYQQHYP